MDEFAPPRYFAGNDANEQEDEPKSKSRKSREAPGDDKPKSKSRMSQEPSTPDKQKSGQEAPVEQASRAREPKEAQKSGPKSGSESEKSEPREPPRRAPPPQRYREKQVRVVVIERRGFDDREVRARFLSRVFTIVTIMLFINCLFAAAPMLHSDLRKWCREHWIFKFVSYVFFFVFYLILMCCAPVRRKFPINLIFLILFTFSAAFFTLFLTAEYSPKTVVLSLLITTVCSASVIVFAQVIKTDLTVCTVVAFILGICLLLFGLMSLIFTVLLGWDFLFVVYSALAALLAMFYLAIDIQMIMGNRRVQIAPNEYIYAAITLFVDIFMIFINILGIFGRN